MTYAAGSSAVPVWSNRLRLEGEPLVVPESETMEAGATISDLRYGRLGVKVGSGVLDFVAVVTRVGVHTGVNVTVGVTGVLEGVRLTVGVIGVFEGVSDGGTGVLVTDGVTGVFEGATVGVSVGAVVGRTVAVAVGNEAISIRCTKTSGAALVSFGTRLDA